MKAIAGKYHEPLDLTESFKKKCRLAIESLEEAIAQADEHCPYKAESSINEAFIAIRKARRMVDTVADYFDLTEPYKGEEEEKK